MPLTSLAEQFSHSRSPETVRMGDDLIEAKVLLPDAEAVIDAHRILEDPVEVPIPENQGFDDEKTKDEYVEGLNKSIDEAKVSLERETAVGHRVLVTGKLAQFLIDKAAILAEQPDSEAQIAAIKFTTRHEAAQAPTEESNPFEHLSPEAQSAIRRNREIQELEPTELDGVRYPEEDVIEAHRRLASAKHVATLVRKRERSSTDTLPEPIWVDQNGFELGKDEYFKANNFSESTAVFKALERYLHAEGREKELQDFYEDTYENQTHLELKGEKAQDARNALRMVASQSIAEAQEATKQEYRLYGTRNISKRDLEDDQKFAQRMLDIRAQGPKNIEKVELTLDDEVVRTGNVHTRKPNLKLVPSDKAEAAPQRARLKSAA